MSHYVRVLVALLMLVLVASAPPAAAADERVIRDPRGDAVAHIDILRVRFGVSDTGIWMVMKFRRLGRGRPADANLEFERSDRVGSRYVLGVWRDPNTDSTGYVLYDPDPGGEVVDCSGVRFRWRLRDGGRVRAFVPAECIASFEAPYKVSADSLWPYEQRSDHTRSVVVGG